MFVKICSILAMLSSFYGTCLGIYKNGLFVFSYFTTLSNVMVCLYMLICLFITNKNEKGDSSKGFINVYRFISAISISVTFLVYLLILAPTNEKGFIGAYQSNYYASFASHFISPVSMIVHFFIADSNIVEKRKVIPCSITFPLLYLVYSFILGRAGLRWHGMIMPYNFLNYDAPCGWFGFKPNTIGYNTLGIGVAYMIVILFLFFIAVGFCLWKLKAKDSGKLFVK